MAEASITKHMDASAEVVWAVVRDFFGLDKWVPFIDRCTQDGHDRLVVAGEMTIRERLVECDDERRSLTYSIIEGSPAASHEAQITVDQRGSGSEVTYRVTVEPDQLVDVYRQAYEGMLEALAHYAG